MWTNPHRQSTSSSNTPVGLAGLGLADMHQARNRFERFAPLLADLFPELSESQGRIESDLLVVPALQQALGLPPTMGRLWIKADHRLPVAGSVKARGGFHEVLELTERLAAQHDLLQPGNDYRCLGRPAARAAFARYQVAVGSTGNLGMAIGVLAAALGFRSVVHMSADAKTWKKERLRQHGVDVREHTGDYEQAVAIGRQLADADPLCHLSTTSARCRSSWDAQRHCTCAPVAAQGVVVDAEHPLLVYLPCGVGGAPSGIAWGLHQLFGEHVHCFFAEPVQSPCFLAQMLAPPGSHPSVYDHGLSNRTEADGLAVPRASVLAADTMRPLLAGVFTVEDQTLLIIWPWSSDRGPAHEPSAAAGFSGPAYLRDSLLAVPGANHMVWTTGGLLVPDAQFESFLRRAVRRETSI
jgi:D-serine dehydratase